MEINLKNKKAVIFDMDGVLTETATYHAAAWKHIFDEYFEKRGLQRGSKPQPFNSNVDYHRYVDGKPRYDGVDSFLKSRLISLPMGNESDTPDKDTVCGLGNGKNEYFLSLLKREGVKAYPSSIKFVHKIKSMNILVAVISSSRNSAHVLRSANIQDVFDVKVDGIDAAKLGLRGKPDPAIFLEAAKRLNVDPERAVVVEDALAGVEAGRRGKFGLVIGVDRWGHARELKEKGADIVVKDLSELGTVDKI